MESVHRFVCIYPGQIKKSLSKAISQLLYSGSHGYTGLLVSLLQRNYVVYGYRLRASNHGVVSFLHNQCSASTYISTGFIKPSKRYISLHARRLKKLEGREEDLFYKTKKIRNKKILRQIESPMTGSSKDQMETSKRMMTTMKTRTRMVMAITMMTTIINMVT